MTNHTQSAPDVRAINSLSVTTTQEISPRNNRQPKQIEQPTSCELIGVIRRMIHFIEDEEIKAIPSRQADYLYLRLSKSETEDLYRVLTPLAGR